MKKSLKLCLIFISIILLIWIIYTTCILQTPEAHYENPFDISVSDVKIVSENSSSSDEIEKSLYLKILIENNLNAEFNDVWFKTTLNKEVEPYIATHVLSFTSEPINIITKEKAQENIGKSSDACGFEFNWQMVLTDDDTLKEYYNLDSSNGLQESLKSVTIEMFWNSGEQSITIPIEL